MGLGAARLPPACGAGAPPVTCCCWRFVPVAICSEVRISVSVGSS